MRRLSMIFVAASLATASMLAGPAPNAAAIVAGPCYEPQSICVAAFEYPGTHHLELLISGPKSDYFKRYRLCVQAPGGSLSCDVFRVRAPRHRYFVSVIDWRRHFPHLGPGHYSARWRRLPSHRLVGKSGFPVG